MKELYRSIKERIFSHKDKVGFLKKDRIITIEGDKFVPNLRELLKEQNYEKETIIMRFFHVSRLQHFFKKGTDRDENSQIWHGYSEDVQHFGLTEGARRRLAGRIMYARTLDLTADPIVALSMFERPEAKRGYRTFKYQDDLSFMNSLGADIVIVLYDADKVYRASQNEYHFEDQDPKEAVVALFIHPKHSAALS